MCSISNPGEFTLEWLDEDLSDLKEFTYIDEEDIKDLDLNNEVTITFILKSL